MGRPPRVLKDARELRDIGAFVIAIGIVIAFAGILELLELNRPVYEVVFFFVAGFVVIIMGARVVRKTAKIRRLLGGEANVAKM